MKINNASRTIDVLGKEMLGQILIALDINETEIRATFDAATSWDEYLAVYRITSDGGLEREALEKMRNLAKTKLDDCITFQECYLIYCLTPDSDDEFRQRTLDKALSFATCLEEYGLILGKVKEHSPDAYTCIRALNAFLSQSNARGT